MEDFKTWLRSQVADFFDTGIQKLIPRYDGCLSSGSDCVEGSLCMYVFFFFVYNTFFLLVPVSLTADRRLLSE